MEADKKGVLIIGYGSMGKRHARNLAEAGIKPCILTHHPDDLDAIFVKDIKGLKGKGITHCIISSPTAKHLDDLKLCFELDPKPERILVEKPLECSYDRAQQMGRLAKKNGASIYVAYNLRFLGAFEAILSFVRSHKDIRMVEITAGQDLREWRPGTDYSASYSARRAQGGGVDLDLSHELDYALWLFGNGFSDKLMYRKKISNMSIDSPDVFKLVLGYQTFMVDISLDYIRKPKTRYLKVICESGKDLCYDFVSNALTVEGKQVEPGAGLEQSYKDMLRAFLDGKEDRLCSFSQAASILKVLEV